MRFLKPGVRVELGCKATRKAGLTFITVDEGLLHDYCPPIPCCKLSRLVSVLPHAPDLVGAGLRGGCGSFEYMAANELFCTCELDKWKAGIAISMS